MKNWDFYILFIAGAAFVGFLFFGMKSVFINAMKSTPKVEGTITRQEKSDQQQRMRDIKDRQKRLMQDQKQRMRDLQRR